MRRIIGYWRALLNVVEWEANAILLAAAWWVTWMLGSRGIEAVRIAGRPPISLEGAQWLASDPQIIERLLLWGEAFVVIPTAAVVAVSAAQGTWWLLRRLGG